MLVYIGLRGVQGKRTTCTLKVDGVPPLDVHLRDHEDKVVKLRLPAVQSKERLVVISATCTGTADFAMFTNGVDTRIAGIGVRWFYACKENDLAGRLSILEGLSRYGGSLAAASSGSSRFPAGSAVGCVHRGTTREF